MSSIKKHKQNIIIVGNGFDLAHELKTSYADFIHHVIQSAIAEGKFSDLVSLSGTIKNVEIFWIKLGENKLNNSFRNSFFHKILDTYQSANWCDIEHLYYQELSKTKIPELLNQEFQVVKDALYFYLGNILFENQRSSRLADKFKEIKSNRNDLFESVRNVFVNFNYTNIIAYYGEQNDELINIHGQLNSDDNQIIFGYSASSIENNDLLDKNNDEYLFNIKKYQYQKSTAYNKLNSLLDSDTQSDVYVIGHSLGVSDRSIITRIFASNNIGKIHFFFHEDRDHYLKSVYQFDRILKNESLYNKIVGFDSSFIIPQFASNPSYKYWQLLQNQFGVEHIW